MNVIVLYACSDHKGQKKRALGCTRLQLQTTVSHHVSTGTQTLVPRKALLLPYKAK